MQSYNDLINFFTHHWILSLLFLIILYLLIQDILSPIVGTIKQIESKKLISMINNEKNLILVDLRDSKVYQSGHIIHAVNSPIEMPEKLAKIDPNKTIVLYDDQGTSYRKIKTSLKAFKNISALKGGLKKWKQEGFPTTK